MTHVKKFTYKQISQVAQVSKVSIYRYFSGKKVMPRTAQAIELGLAQLGLEVEQKAEAPRTEPASMAQEFPRIQPASGGESTEPFAGLDAPEPSSALTGGIVGAERGTP